MLDSQDALEQLHVTYNKIKNADKLKAEANSKYEKVLAAYQAVILSNDQTDKLLIDELKITYDTALKRKGNLSAEV